MRRIWLVSLCLAGCLAFALLIGVGGLAGASVASASGVSNGSGSNNKHHATPTPTPTGTATATATSTPTATATATYTAVDADEPYIFTIGAGSTTPVVYEDWVPRDGLPLVLAQNTALLGRVTVAMGAAGVGRLYVGVDGYYL